MKLSVKLGCGVLHPFTRCRGVRARMSEFTPLGVRVGLEGVNGQGRVG